MGERSNGERIDAGKPIARAPVVLVLGDRQGDEHVRTEDEGGHSSSNAAATSSAVTGRPMDRTGSPDRSSVASVTVVSSWAKPRMVRSAITADRD